MKYCLRLFQDPTALSKILPRATGAAISHFPKDLLRPVTGTALFSTNPDESKDPSPALTKSRHSGGSMQAQFEMEGEPESELVDRFADMGFQDFEFEQDKIPDEPSKKDMQKLQRSETVQKNIEEWKEIKRKGLGKARFPDLKACFQQPVHANSYYEIRNRPLVDVTAVFRHNAWDNIEWDQTMKEEADRKVQNNSSVLVNEEKKQDLEHDASKFWDEFYGIHKNKFFKERNWLFSEFPELKGPCCSVSPEVAAEEIRKKRKSEDFPGENSEFRVLEIGCGNGSTVFPLLAMNNNPELYVYCCDFSPSAVEIVRSSPKFESGRCRPFVWDVTSDITNEVPLESLDIIVLIFVMSAISPDKFDKVLSNFYKLLKPGGLILFRDYGKYDLVQLRFGEGRCISENFYVRGDGTRVYFFDQEEVVNLFQRNSFAKEAIHMDSRLQVNRLKQLKMYRIWILGKFRKV